MSKQKVREEQEGELEKDIGLLTHEDMPKRPGVVYVPQMDYSEHKTFLDHVGRYWNEYKPRNVFEYAGLVTNPAAYALWRMPNETHQYLNKALQYATKVSALTGQEEIALATGITYAISQAVYGLKNKSAKHVMSGLVGIISNAKKIDSSKLSVEDKVHLDGAVKNAEKVLSHMSSKVKEDS